MYESIIMQNEAQSFKAVEYTDCIAASIENMEYPFIAITSTSPSDLVSL